MSDLLQSPGVGGGKKKQMDLKIPKLMGVLNVTPDSFSDGGKFLELEDALKKARQMIGEGADIIDIGGESSGITSKDVSLDEELRRVLPVVEALRRESDVWISVDTHKSVVARRVLEKGADIINDITALRGDPVMVEVVAEFQAPLVMMYSKDPSARTTVDERDYDDVFQYVSAFLLDRIDYAVSLGVRKGQIILDPGMGAFVSAKAKYSLEILRRQEEFKALGCPILVGPSRKSFIGEVLGLPVEERLEGTLACVAVAVMNGANILRVHDVNGARRVVDMVAAIKNSG